MPTTLFHTSQSNPFILGQPPANVNETVSSSSGITSKTRNDLAPYGKVYWSIVSTLYGSTLQKDSKSSRNSKSKDKKSNHDVDDFPDELIKIPLNVTPKNLRKFNLYDLLGLGEHAGSADENAIRKAYHKCVLIYHPDKKQDKTSTGAEDNSVWLKIQEAFSTLLDVKKRRAYDSQLPFDESVPTDQEIEASLAQGGEAFFELFGKVFKRNSRFAEIKPVPDIGNSSTPIDQVENFYAYWVNFESWRDFTGVGAEYRPDEASSREEKRFMIKENEKLAIKLKKKEILRITDMTTKAMKLDPRLVAYKLAQKALKESEKKAKEEAAAQALVNAAQQAEKAKEEAALSKAEKEKMRKKASAARNAFRKLLRSVCEISKDGDGEYGSIDSDDMEAMLAKKETVEVIELVDAMGGEAAVKSPDLLCVDAGLAAVKLALDNFKNNVSVVKTNDKLDSEKKSDGTSKQSSEGSTRTWNREELSALAKAVAKYPSGLGQRWVAVCNNLNDLLKPANPYTVEECMKAAHDAVKNASKIKK